MLASLKVSNFKGFDKEFEFSLKEINGFQFNSECIKNNLVNSALVYGHNAVGKSNLGYAIFDIVGHLTDNNLNEQQYNSNTYLNALNEGKTAKFEYEFHFDDNIVIYEYEKVNVRMTILERLLINGRQVAFIDRRKNEEAEINFEGAETLNKLLTNESLSLLKYVRNNSVLVKNKENSILQNLFAFVDGMLLFCSIFGPTYIGLEKGSTGIQEDIIANGNIEDFESFLNKAGIDCKIKVEEELDGKILAFDFDGKLLSFYDVASSGTKSLILFYLWRQRFKEQGKVSFLFIDEFDAYYHHELSAFIVEELKSTGVQFVLTSHNTSIITNDLLRPDCYFLMKKDSIKSLAQSTPKELREAHNIEKMYKAGSFNG